MTTATDTKTLEAKTMEILKAAGLWEAMGDLVVQDIQGHEVILFSLTGGKEDIKELLWFWLTSPLIETDYSDLEINIDTKLAAEPIILITQNPNI